MLKIYFYDNKSTYFIYFHVYDPHKTYIAIAENYSPTQKLLLRIYEFKSVAREQQKHGTITIAHLLWFSVSLALASTKKNLRGWWWWLTLSWNFEYHKNEINNRNHDLFSSHWYWKRENTNQLKISG